MDIDSMVSYVVNSNKVKDIPIAFVMGVLSVVCDYISRVYYPP